MNLPHDPPKELLQKLANWDGMGFLQQFDARKLEQIRLGLDVVQPVAEYERAAICYAIVRDYFNSPIEDKND